MDEKQLARFLPKVEKTAGCWFWKAAINNSGYGVFGMSSGSAKNAHRVSYEHWKGPIPEGMEIDHLCRVKNCVNPDHLRVVNHVENMRCSPNPNALKTHCKRGHSLADFYPSHNPDGTISRRCKKCHNAIVRKYMERYRREKKLGLR